MLYVCVPTYNEAVTVGVLLWRLRTMLREQAGGRDYEVVVYDDASTDATPDVLAPYARVLPLTFLRGERRLGQSAAVDALVRHVLARSRTPESDAVVLMQADYTDAPELLAELLARFDAGADLVLTRRVLAAEQPHGERRLRRAAALLLPPLARPAIREAGARDPAVLLSFLRLVRVSVLREAVRTAGTGSFVVAPGWAGTAELTLRTAPFAHRIERVDAPARYDVRTRPSRIDWTRELRAVASTLWQHRGAARPRPAPAIAAGAVVGSAAGSVVGSAPDSVSRWMDHPTTDTPSDTHTPRATTLRVTPADAMPAAPSASAPAPAEETTPDAGAPGRTPKRRRRGRGRSRETGPVTDAPEVAGDEHTRAPDTPAPSLTLVASAPDDAVPDADLPHDAAAGSESSAPDAAAKRRRRRGGARRRSRGSERDSGVRPEDADADPAPWHGAPSDQPPS